MCEIILITEDKCEIDNSKVDCGFSTKRATFENIENITSFKMDGRFLFKEDSVIIMAYGYEGCIFGVDTIQHAQSWKISGDTLYLLNEANLQGISYLITSKTDQSIELQLMDDIFIHLNKVL